LDKFGKAKWRIFSLLITFSIIVTLVLLGPAAAIKMIIHGPPHQEATVGDVEMFIAEIKILPDDGLKVTTVTLKINGVDCEFPAKGGISITQDPLCEGITAKKLGGRTKKRRYGYNDYGYKDKPKPNYGYDTYGYNVYGYTDKIQNIPIDAVFKEIDEKIQDKFEQRKQELFGNEGGETQ